MHVISSSPDKAIELGGVTFTLLASASSGSLSTSMWLIRLQADADGQQHHVDKEELIHALAGKAVATVDGKELALNAGDTLVVTPGQLFSLRKVGAEAFEALAVAPHGMQATVGESRFTPPWTL